MTKPVFGTHLETLHHLACFKRDTQGDVLDFDKQLESKLCLTAREACREEKRKERIGAKERQLDSWWAVDRVVLFDDGTVRCTVRTNPDGGKDEMQTRFVYIAHTVCERSAVPALIEHEKSVLSYWFIPE